MMAACRYPDRLIHAVPFLGAGSFLTEHQHEFKRRLIAIFDTHTEAGVVVVGRLSALGAALLNAGISKDHVIHYESAIQADGFLVMAHGPADELARARGVLQGHQPSSLELHSALPAAVV